MASYLPATHKYIPRVEQRENNLFTEEYYSSTDIDIYIDGIEQTEISYISYAVQEQLKPLYGYSSRTFDDVSIGNRIVTGILKVPIKNPEAQTPLEDIIDSMDKIYKEPDYGEPSNDDYNNKEDDLLGSKDWIDSGDDEDSIITDSNIMRDEDMYEYVTKLKTLGYDLDYNSTMLEILGAIKQFQEDNKKLEVNGVLTEATKMEIDKTIKESNLDRVTISKGVRIRKGPSNIHDIILTTNEKTEAIVLERYVINNDSETWLIIQLEDGTQGYIRESDTEG